MILQTEHLSKSYGGRTLFHDVTFRLEEYDRLALVGPNGAGKTTLLNIISGEDDPDEGRVLFAKGARVGYLEQEAIEMGDLPVFEEVISSQTEVLEAEQRLHKLEAELGANPTEAQLAAVLEDAAFYRNALPRPRRRGLIEPISIILRVPHGRLLE